MNQLQQQGTSGAGGGSKKRKQGDRVFSFKNFCSPGYPAHFTGGSFQENLRQLLDFGDRVDLGERRWSFPLEVRRHPPLLLTLYVLEEIVHNSPHRRCHHCRFIGWGHHMICNRRFHFVVPLRRGPPHGHRGDVAYGELLAAPDSKGVGVGDDGSAGKTPSSSTKVAMRFQGQLMHGLVHSNGFGHLLCVNGIGGGAEIVSGRQLVELWDRICSALHLRKVSLADTARKGTMSLRLIHGVAYGEAWFGNWGYRFGRGSYGVTQQMYNNSVETLRSLPLCLLVPHYGGLRHDIPPIVAKYQAISCNSLLTLGHLFHFMLELKRRLPPDTITAMDYRGIAAEPACRWSTKRVEMAAQVIVDALKKAGNQWIPRQDVRDAARIYIGDTGLLDFVLKSIGNHVVGSHMVRRMVNPVTKVLEYCLEDASHALPGGGDDHLPGIRSRPQLLTRVQLMRDMLCLYRYILKEQNPAIATGMFGAIPLAVRAVLDAKQLVKDYGGDQLTRKTTHLPNTIQLLCTVHLQAGVEYYDGGKRMTSSSPQQLSRPHDPIALPAKATIGDLKSKAEAHFKETYLGLRGFTAESIIGVDEGKDTDILVGVVGAGGSVAVVGRNETEGGDGGMVDEIYEGDGRVVDCHCGAKEEDGERMVCCDVCEVWQHTRCLQIPNNEDIPGVFLCRSCERDIMALPSFLL